MYELEDLSDLELEQALANAIGITNSLLGLDTHDECWYD